MNIVPYVIGILIFLVIVSGVVYYFVTKDPDAKALKEEQERYNPIHEKYKSLLDK